jgi:hypothetical protein
VAKVMEISIAEAYELLADWTCRVDATNIRKAALGVYGQAKPSIQMKAPHQQV